MTAAPSSPDRALIDAVSTLTQRVDVLERDMATMRAAALPVNPIERLIVAAAAITGQAPRDLVGRQRSQRLDRVRWAIMRVAREITDASLPEVGRAFGGRDHTTVRHGLTKAELLFSVDSSFADLCAQITAATKASLPIPFGSPVPPALAAELLTQSRQGA